MSAVSAVAAQPDAAGIEFFEKRIRPVLIDNCYKCHSKDSDKIKGGLVVDTRDGLLKGGDTGPAIVPGDPEKSLLVKAVRYEDESIQMPPKKRKLPAGQIADLVAWIKMGAPDPRDGKTVAASGPPLSDPIKVKNHWAYQPLKEPAIPAVKNKRWIQNSVDSFVLAKLEGKGMTPSPPADKRTLIRRATFDLTGIPPRQSDVDAFLADKTPEAFARVIDRLLASPQYGERWARYWLDVARYSDTKGYVFEEERRYPFAYTYRDYVIRSFNEDLPYDQFLLQQIAADLLPLGEDQRPLAALGFLTLGRRFLNNQADIIDDRIDVVTRGTMGLTVGCARCHDHKYDPIPTRDYYSLYGVFASCNEPKEKPSLGTASLSPAYPAYMAEHKKRVDELEGFRTGKENEWMKKLRDSATDYLLAAREARKLADDPKRENLFRSRKLDPGIATRWMKSLDGWVSQKTPDRVFGPWAAFSEISDDAFSMKAREVSARFAAAKEINPLVAKAFAGDPPASMKEVAERYNKIFSTVESETAFADKEKEEVRQVLFGADAPCNPGRSQLDRLFATPDSQKVRALQRAIDELDATHPGVPPRAMALKDNATPESPRIFIRGNPGNPGPEVPRQFLQIAAGPDRKPFQKGSGRLEMAQAIVSRDNPLTARVMVNRVWLHHFGAGLVRTPSDFGVRSDPPSHPELLDWLAVHFMADGWSLKKLHRAIMLSSAYQQSSDDRPDYAVSDPNNQWIWKMNRQRLDLEALRDTLLAVTGRLEMTVGGQAVDLTTAPFATRRTVYGFIDRQNLPGLFRAFDFASPDASSPQRFYTTVPQQALFMMNSPFVQEQAQRLIERPEFKSLGNDEDRIRLLYKIAYQRAPAADEIKMARHYLEIQPARTAEVVEQSGWHYGFGRFDAGKKQVTHFEALPYFTGSAWQGGDVLPDAQLGYVLLTASGGHTGNDLAHAAIRRWVAPRDGVVDIRGSLNHPEERGDGVRGRIVSSRGGLLGEWVAHHQKMDTIADKITVKEGDTIDFVVDLRENVDFDSFEWVPHIKYVTGMKGSKSRLGTDTTLEWDAQADFGKAGREQAKPLTPWERYAQILLLSNELAFVD